MPVSCTRGHSRQGEEIDQVKDILAFLEMLNLVPEACERYGRLVNDLQRSGVMIGDIDTMIASIALTYNETIVTSDIEHFEGVPGLIVEVWQGDPRKASLRFRLCDRPTRRRLRVVFSLAEDGDCRF